MTPWLFGLAALGTLELLGAATLHASSVEELAPTVAFLRSEAILGTGFFSALDDSHLYLVTAEHVARTATRRT
jgi:hypothetical protein